MLGWAPDGNEEGKGEGEGEEKEEEGEEDPPPQYERHGPFLKRIR